MANIALISLGCEKNLVNSEQMLWLLDKAGHVTCEPEDADVCIVNTCGFIDSAKSEAIDNILALDELRSEGHDFKILVTGCLSQRYPDEILEQLPEVDGILGCGSFEDIVAAVDEVLSGEKPRHMGDLNAPVSNTPRMVTTPRWYSYIRIAEGCDNYCAYCVIPYLRGHYRSRPMEDVIAEAKALAQNGTRELLVIAQDVTRYGTDLKDGTSLAKLVNALCEIEELRWIRLHYLYPDEFTDELLDVMASQPKVLPYFDIPLQHVNNRILRDMNRRSTKAEITTLLDKIREKIPAAVIRTSIICGLPGETEEEFAELCEFLKEYKLQRAGFFAFSPEEGTPAAEMENQIPDEVKNERVMICERIQDAVMTGYNESRLGKPMEVLCEGYDEELGEYTGRSRADSPTIDETVYFTFPMPIEPGSFVLVRPERVEDGELHCEGLQVLAIS